jgi:Flp pilus assembly protein TadG
MKVIPKPSHKERGDSLLEFAFAVPLLLIVSFGLLDLGRAFFSVIIISNASREGARYLTRHPKDYKIDGFGNTFSGTKNAAIAEANGSIVNLDPADIDIFNCTVDALTDACKSGIPIEVRVTTQTDLVMGWIMQGPITVTRSTKMMVP